MSLAQKIRDRIREETTSMWTSALGVVVNGGSSRVDVKLKHRIKVNDETVTFPVLTDVPVVWPCSSAFHVASYLERGDVVLLVFTKFNKHGMLESSQDLVVADDRMFDYNDVICIPGFFLSSTTPNVSSGEAILQHSSGSYIKFNSDGGITIYCKSLNVNEMP